MGKRGLVLGGGGPVGIAWEIGLAAGLAEQGVQLANADKVVGTSAGSFVGAQLASGRSPASLLAAQIEQGEREQKARAEAAAKGPRGKAPDLTALMKFFARRPATEAEAQAWRVELGQFALEAPTIPEEAFLKSFGHITSDGVAWPKGYACTAVDALDGRFVVWDENANVALGHAIASSCSVPGVFPPVTINGRRYIDGGMRSGTSFDLARDCERVIAVAVMGNLSTDAMRAGIDAELDVLREAGVKVELVIPNAECRDAFGPNLMDGTRRGPVATVGLKQGREEATRLKGFWG